MKLYAVIDTNVIVSALLKEDSVPGYIVNLATKGIVVPVLNTGILTEYITVINRNKFDFSEAKIKIADGSFRSSSAIF